VRPRLFLHVVSLEARTRLSYRGDFWINTIPSVAAHFALVYYLWAALFRESGQARLAGFDLGGMLLYYGSVILLGKIVEGPRFEREVSQDIYEGGLNRYLVFPTAYFPFKYAQHLGTLVPVVLQAVLFGAVIALLVGPTSGVHVTPLTVAMAAVSTLVANLLYFVMSFPIQAVAFWADNVWSLAVAQTFIAGLLGGRMLPLALFPAWCGDVLPWLPFRHFFDVPVQTLLGRLPPLAWLEALGAALAWCAVLGLVGRAVWLRGDRQYSGIGI
jgi:viologen exporter family transport system permease protein